MSSPPAWVAQLRAAHWIAQRDRGITTIPSNDFSLYDHVLDTAVMVGAIPQAYGWSDGEVWLDLIRHGARRRRHEF